MELFAQADDRVSGTSCSWRKVRKGDRPDAASDHRLIEVLPPQIEVSSPGAAKDAKKKDKKHVVEAEQIPVDDFRVNRRKLAPGERADGVVTFTRPGFKQSHEKILLQIASANSVDLPLLLPVPFVASGY